MARRFKQKRNKLLRSRGHSGTVPADRAAAHIARLRAAGLQDKGIIAETGLGRNTFYRALRGLPLTRDVEKRILAVPVPRTARQVSTVASVPAVGTHRRLQALMRQGWPPGVLEGRLGYHQGWISRDKGMEVVVSGRVKTDQWEAKDGSKRSTPALYLDSIGPSLRSATAVVTKSGGSGRGQQQVAEERQRAGQAGMDDPWTSTPGGGQSSGPAEGQAGAWSDETPF